MPLKPVIADFETAYDRQYSLSKMTVEEYCRDPRFEIIGLGLIWPGEKAKWLSGSLRAIRNYVQALDWSDKLVIGHNMVFDGWILENILDVHPGMYADTLSMARPLHGISVGGSLSKLAKHYGIGEKGTEVLDALGKRRKDFTPAELAAYGRYCVNDCRLTGKLFRLFLPHFTPTELRVIDLTLRMAIQPVFRVDVPHLEAALERLQNEKHEQLLELGRELGLDLTDADGAVETVRQTLSSNPKFAEFLRSRGVTPPMKPSPSDQSKLTFAFAKSDPGLLELQEHDDPLVVAAVEARMGVKSTVRETRMQTIIAAGKRGPLPFPLRYAGAHTNRWSGDWKWNLQNLPKHIDPKNGRREPLRDALLAPPGHVIVAFDSSQIEARVNAWFWGQEDLVELFATGGDPYCAFASIAYGRPITKADTNERFVGKGCVLGLGFQLGAPKLQVSLRKPVNGVSVDLPLKECTRLVDIYRSTNDRIREGWFTCKRAISAMHVGAIFEFGVGATIVASEGRLTLPSGNVLRYDDLQKQTREVERDGVMRMETAFTYLDREKRKRKYLYGGKLTENIVQSMARDIIAWQATQIQKCWPVKGNVHDELLVVAKAEEAERCAQYVEAVMKTVPAWARGCPVSCEGARAESYGYC